MSNIEFFFRIEPDIPKLTHQHGVEPVHAGGRTFMHKTRDQENLEAFYVSHLRGFAPPKPLAGPLRLETEWVFSRPKRAKGIWKTTKPDTDNLVKTLKDCMKKAGFYEDDALVAHEITSKLWADADEPHGIIIRLSAMEDAP